MKDELLLLIALYLFSKNKTQFVIPPIGPGPHTNPEPMPKPSWWPDIVPWPPPMPPGWPLGVAWPPKDWMPG